MKKSAAPIITSRRKFLSKAGAATAVLAGGAAVLEPLLDAAVQAQDRRSPSAAS